MSKYKFSIDTEGNTTHAKILSLVGENKTVLDVGCASGYLAEVLKNKFACNVSGIELDQEDAKLAEAHCEKVVSGNIETLDLSNSFQKDQFDVVIFADILEHLVNPKDVLLKILPFCKDGVIISLPNISHSSVLYELLNGDFRYRDLGLLDNTHLRFFTKKSAIDMLEECGLTVETILKTRLNVAETEIKPDTSKFPEEVKRFIESQTDADVYQYVILAKKSKNLASRDPQEGDRSLLYLEKLNQDLTKENLELKKVINQKEETITWYNKTLKENMTSHYAHKNTYDELCIIKAEHEKLLSRVEGLQSDRDRCVAHADRLQKFSPESLPKILGLPLKAMILMWTSGPFSPVRVLKKKSSPKPVRPENQIDCPKVDLITLVYNSEKFLDSYFSAVSKIKYPAEKLRINLVNNCSPDKSLEIIQEKYLNNKDIPFEIIIHESPDNLGFSGGNNLVLKKLLKQNDSAYAFLLNHDTEIDPDCINHLVKLISSDSTIGMVEAKQKPKEHPKFYDKKTLETSWCSGGCVLISLNALKKAGLFDDRFFLYVEDVDLSWRMWLEGFSCKINPQATCTHHTESLNEDKDFSLQQYYTVRNTFYMRYKYGTREEIQEFEKLFEQALLHQATEADKNNLVKARKDAKANMRKFLLDRWKLSTKARPHWIKFSGFNFGRTRAFEDTQNGGRIIYDEVA